MSEKNISKKELAALGLMLLGGVTLVQGVNSLVWPTATSGGVVRQVKAADTATLTVTQVTDDCSGVCVNVSVDEIDKNVGKIVFTGNLAGIQHYLADATTIKNDGKKLSEYDLEEDTTLEATFTDTDIATADINSILNAQLSDKHTKITIVNFVFKANNVQYSGDLSLANDRSVSADFAAASVVAFQFDSSLKTLNDAILKYKDKVKTGQAQFVYGGNTYNFSLIDDVIRVNLVNGTPLTHETAMTLYKEIQATDVILDYMIDGANFSIQKDDAGTIMISSSGYSDIYTAVAAYNTVKAGDVALQFAMNNVPYNFTYNKESENIIIAFGQNDNAVAAINLMAAIVSGDSTNNTALAESVIIGCSGNVSTITYGQVGHNWGDDDNHILVHLATTTPSAIVSLFDGVTMDANEIIAAAGNNTVVRARKRDADGKLYLDLIQLASQMESSDYKSSWDTATTALKKASDNSTARTLYNTMPAEGTWTIGDDYLYNLTGFSFPNCDVTDGSWSVTGATGCIVNDNVSEIVYEGTLADLPKFITTFTQTSGLNGAYYSESFTAKVNGATMTLKITDDTAGTLPDYEVTGTGKFAETAITSVTVEQSIAGDYQALQLAETLAATKIVSTITSGNGVFTTDTEGNVSVKASNPNYGYTDYQSAAAGIINTAGAIHKAGISETDTSKAYWLKAVKELAAMGNGGTVANLIDLANNYRYLAEIANVDVTNTHKSVNYDIVIKFFEFADIMDDNRVTLESDKSAFGSTTVKEAYAVANDIYGEIIKAMVNGDGGKVGSKANNPEATYFYDNYINAAEDIFLAAEVSDYQESDYYTDNIANKYFTTNETAVAGIINTAGAIWQNSEISGDNESDGSKQLWRQAIALAQSADLTSETAGDVVAKANEYAYLAQRNGADLSSSPNKSYVEQFIGWAQTVAADHDDLAKQTAVYFTYDNTEYTVADALTTLDDRYTTIMTALVNGEGDKVGSKENNTEATYFYDDYIGLAQAMASAYGNTVTAESLREAINMSETVKSADMTVIVVDGEAIQSSKVKNVTYDDGENKSVINLFNGDKIAVDRTGIYQGDYKASVDRTLSEIATITDGLLGSAGLDTIISDNQRISLDEEDGTMRIVDSREDLTEVLSEFVTVNAENLDETDFVMVSGTLEGHNMNLFRMPPQSQCEDTISDYCSSVYANQVMIQVTDIESIDDITSIEAKVQAIAAANSSEKFVFLFGEGGDTVTGIAALLSRLMPQTYAESSWSNEGTYALQYTDGVLSSIGVSALNSDAEVLIATFADWTNSVTLLEEIAAGATDLEIASVADDLDQVKAALSAAENLSNTGLNFTLSGKDFTVTVSGGALQKVTFASDVSMETAQKAVSSTTSKYVAQVNGQNYSVKNGKIVIPSNGGGNSGQGSNSASNASASGASASNATQKTCSATTPVGESDLFQIDRVGTKATIYFTPVSDYTDRYHVIFGNEAGDERYGGIAMSVSADQNTGVLALDIDNLEPGQQYSFKVAPVNDCAVGTWSNWLTAKGVTRYGKAAVKTFRYTGKVTR